MKYSQSLVRNGLALFIEFIPHAPDGMDHVAIAAELVPEELYLPVHGSVLAVIIISPDSTEDLVPGQYDPFVIDKIFQQIIFLGRQSGLPTIDIQVMAARIKGKAAECQAVFQSRLRSRAFL